MFEISGMHEPPLPGVSGPLKTPLFESHKYLELALKIQEIRCHHRAIIHQKGILCSAVFPTFLQVQVSTPGEIYKLSVRVSTVPLQVHCKLYEIK